MGRGYKCNKELPLPLVWFKEEVAVNGEYEFRGSETAAGIRASRVGVWGAGKGPGSVAIVGERRQVVPGCSPPHLVIHRSLCDKPNTEAAPDCLWCIKKNTRASSEDSSKHENKTAKRRRKDATSRSFQ